MPMQKGFWRKVDWTKLKGGEQTAFNAYKLAVENKGTTFEQREKARSDLINALEPRLRKNGLIPHGQELAVMFNRRNFFIGFKDRKDSDFFDLGNP